MNTTKTNTTKGTEISYTVPAAKIADLLTAERLIVKVATVEYLTAATFRVTFRDR